MIKIKEIYSVSLGFTREQVAFLRSLENASLFCRELMRNTTEFKNFLINEEKKREKTHPTLPLIFSS